MNHRGLTVVQISQRLQDLHHVDCGHGRVHGTLSQMQMVGQFFLESLAMNQVQDDVAPAFDFKVVSNPGNVRVLQARQGLHLALEGLEHISGVPALQGGGEDLFDGARSRGQLVVDRLVHRAHASAFDIAHDLVAFLELFTDCQSHCAWSIPKKRRFSWVIFRQRNFSILGVPSSRRARPSRRCFASLETSGCFRPTGGDCVPPRWPVLPDPSRVATMAVSLPAPRPHETPESSPC